MRKFLLALALVCFTAPAFAAQDINAGISGTWYNPAKDGHGFAVEYVPQGPGCSHPEGCLAVFWFVYSPSGEPIFLLGHLPVSGNVAEGELFYFSNQKFGSFTPAPNSDVWGTLSLTFTECGKGRAHYETDFVSPDGDDFADSGTFPIERLTFIGDLDCERAVAISNMPTNPLAGLWVGLALQDDSDNSFNVDALITEDGTAYFFGFGLYLATGEVSEQGVNELNAYAAFGLKFPNGQSTSQISVNPNVFPVDRLEGGYTVPAEPSPISGSLLLRYQPLFTRDATMDRISGRWRISILPDAGTDINIKPNGKLVSESALGSNNPNTDLIGCKLNGTVAPQGDGHFNVYDVTVELTECENGSFNGSYAGVAWVEDVGVANVDKRLLLRLENGTWALIAGGNKLDPN